MYSCYHKISTLQVRLPPWQWLVFLVCRLWLVCDTCNVWSSWYVGYGWCAILAKCGGSGMYVMVGVRHLQRLEFLVCRLWLVCDTGKGWSSWYVGYGWFVTLAKAGVPDIWVMFGCYSYASNITSFHKFWNFEKLCFEQAHLL